MGKRTYLGIASPGDILEYLLSFTNTGSVELPNAVLTEELPYGVKFVGYGWHPAGGNLYTRTVSVKARNLLGFARFRIQIDEDFTGRRITNTVWLDHPTIADALGNLYPLDPVSATYTLVITGIKTLSKAAEPPDYSTVYWGQPVTYTIAFSNVYGTEFSTLVISDSLPQGLFYDITPLDGGALADSRTVTWTFTNVGVGEALSVRFTARVTPGLDAGTVITNRAYSFAYVLGEADPILIQESNPVRFTVKSAPFEIAKSATPPAGSQVKWGQTITYHVTVTNAGYYTVTSVAITDTVDPDLEILNPYGGAVQGNLITWALPSLRHSARFSFTARVKDGLPRGEVLSNLAYVYAYASGLFASEEITHVVAGPSTLGVFKRSEPPAGSSLQYGQLVTYTIEYQNGGGSAALNTVITDLVDTAAFEFVGASPGGTYQDGVVRWELGSVPADGTGTVTLTLRVKKGAPAGVVTNTAYIAAANLPFAASTPVTHVFVGPPALRVSKQAEPPAATPVMPGQLITYTLAFTNEGSYAANAYLADRLPRYVNVVDTGGATSSGDLLRWDGISLGLGESDRRSFTVQVNPLLIRCRDYTILNEDYLAGADEAYGSYPGRRVTGAITHPVRFPPDLAVSVDDGKAKVYQGEALVYTVAYSNVCGVSIDGVAITLTLGPGVNAGANPAWTDLGGGRYRYDVGSLAGGEGGTVNFNATAPTLTDGSFGVTATIGAPASDWNPVNNTYTDWDITGGVDLVVRKIEVRPVSTEPGGFVQVRVVVANQGDAPTTGGYEGAWIALSLHLKPYPGGPPAGPGTDWDYAQHCPDLTDMGGYCMALLPLLDAGEEYTKTFDVAVGSDEGVYNLYAYVDAWASGWPGGDEHKGYVTETCEINNVGAWYGLYVASGVGSVQKVYLPLVMKG